MDVMESRPGGTWRMVAAMVLSGTIGWFVVTSGQPVKDVVFFRCLVGGAALLTLLALRRGWVQVDRRRAGWLVLGGVALVANWLCLFSAYNYCGISVATVVYHTQPFFLLILTSALQREPFPFNRLPWLVLAFAGVVLITGLEYAGGLGGGIFVGIVLALMAALLYAVTTIATRRLYGMPPEQIAGVQMVIGVLMLAPLVHPAVSTYRPLTWGTLLALGLVHTGFMYTLLYGAFQRLGVVAIATLSFIYPLVALIIDVTVFHLTLSLAQIAGMGLVVVAVLANQLGWRLTLAGEPEES